MIRAPLNLPAEQRAALAESEDQARAGFVPLRNTALRGYHWPQVLLHPAHPAHAAPSRCPAAPRATERSAA